MKRKKREEKESVKKIIEVVTRTLFFSSNTYFYPFLQIIWLIFAEFVISCLFSPQESTRPILNTERSVVNFIKIQLSSLNLVQQSFRTNFHSLQGKLECNVAKIKLATMNE